MTKTQLNELAKYTRDVDGLEGFQRRHNNGNIRKSIEINANRFGISPQLVKILENTVTTMLPGE